MKRKKREKTIKIDLKSKRAKEFVAWRISANPDYVAFFMAADRILGDEISEDMREVMNILKRSGRLPGSASVH